MGNKLCLIWHLSIEAICRRRTAVWKACCHRKTEPTRVPLNSQARGAFPTIQSDVLWSAMLSSAQATGFCAELVGRQRLRFDAAARRGPRLRAHALRRIVKWGA